jgi:hypothetical protein
MGKQLYACAVRIRKYWPERGFPRNLAEFAAEGDAIFARTEQKRCSLGGSFAVSDTKNRAYQ